MSSLFFNNQTSQTHNAGRINVRVALNVQYNCQWLKCHLTQGNVVPAPPIIDIQRSHTISFIKTFGGPQPPVWTRDVRNRFLVLFGFVQFFEKKLGFGSE